MEVTPYRQQTGGKPYQPCVTPIFTFRVEQIQGICP